MLLQRDLVFLWEWFLDTVYARRSPRSAEYKLFDYFKFVQGSLVLNNESHSMHDEKRIFDVFAQTFSYHHFPDDDNKENQANGKLESPIKWSTQNGSDSGTYAEIGGANSNTSERNVLDPADSSEEEVPLPEATSPGRSSDGPEPRADITASLDRGEND